MRKALHIACCTCLLLTSIDCLAQEQGFFLSDWQPKNISAPQFNDAAKPTSTITTTVTVDANNILTKVSKYLFGNNANPYMTQVVTEPTLLSHITNLSPNVIRMPGGNIGSVYFWNAAPGAKPADAPDSLLDADGKKIDGGYWYGKNTASWTMSLDNYYNMLQQTGSTGIITVNYGYARYSTAANPVASAAHLAADWVRYDNGRTKFWEIGNESNGTWQAGYRIDLNKNKDGQPEFITGALYGQHVKVFIDSMKKAAQDIGKTIYIGAQLLERAPESWQTATDKSWNQGVHTMAGSVADYYIVHSYYTPYNANSNATEVLNSALTVTKSMFDYVKQNTQTNGVTQKPLALTEYNIFAIGSMQMVSHINGMHAALVLGELIKNKYGLACRWDLANSWDNGNDHGTFSQGSEPGVPLWNPRPSFYHMYYFQKFFGDQMIFTSVSGSTDIVVYASTFASGQVGAVIANKGTVSETVRLNFQNFSPGDRYYWYTLTGDNDNGEFSRKVIVNGTGPGIAGGGPTDYVNLKANSAMSSNDVKITAPPRSVTYMLVEKGSITTGVVDIDPADKLIKVFPNPSKNGNFELSFNGFLPVGRTDIKITNVAGQTVFQKQIDPVQQTTIRPYLQKGVYYIRITLSKGTTIKTLIVD